MKTFFYTPVIGNIIGWLRTVGRKSSAYTVQLPSSHGVVVVNVYEVKSFFILKTIIGQAIGQYIFIRSDIQRDTYDWKRVMLHELKHVEQQCEHGWFGIWFLILYASQFVIYTAASMGSITLALKRMPLEREAYATELQIKPAVKVNTPPVN